MKSLDEIWEEYIDHDSLSVHSLKELAWHIEYDPNPVHAITMATDMGLEQLASYIAKQLENNDDYVRELSIGCLLDTLQLPEYAEKGLKMAQEDPGNGVRDLSIFSLGSVMNKIQDKNLRHKIAYYLYQKLTDLEPIDSLDSYKGAAYRSILEAMEVPILERPRVRDLGKEIDFDLVERFKKKYGIEE